MYHAIKHALCFILISLLVLGINRSYGQSPAWLWAKSPVVTISGSVSGNSIVTDSKANVIVCGSFESSVMIFGKDTLKNNGSGYNDIFLVKYDSGGKEVWARAIGEPMQDGGLGVTVDGSDNIYITGYYGGDSICIGATLLPNNNTNEGNMFVAKYDAGGNVLWAKCTAGIGTNYEATGTSVATDASGNVYVTGAYSGPLIVFGSDSIKNKTSVEPMFIVKYDATGNLLWARSSGDTIINDGMTVDMNGNSIVVGYFSSKLLTFGTDTVFNNGFYKGDNYAAFLVKYDGSGNVLWARSSGDSGFVASTSVASDASGNIYFAGGVSVSSVSFGKDTLKVIGNAWTVSFISKYDANGNELWTQGAICPRVSGAGAGGSGITMAPNGNVYVVGCFWKPYLAFGTDTLFNKTNYDIFLAGYSPNGIFLWAKGNGNSVNDYGNAIATDASGSIYITGDFADTLFFGNDTVFSNYSDVYVAKLNPGLTGVNEINSNSEEIKVYPNPCDGVFNFLANGQQLMADSRIEVYNILGEKIYSKIANGQQLIANS